MTEINILGVQSRHFIDRIYGQPFRFDCRSFADELAECEEFEGLEPSLEVAGTDEVGEVISQLIMVVVVEAFDGRVVDRPVSPFDLAAIPQYSPRTVF